MVLDRYEYSKIPNAKLPGSWQSQMALDELLDFLQQNWEQRSVFYEDGEINSIFFCSSFWIFLAPGQSEQKSILEQLFLMVSNLIFIRECSAPKKKIMKQMTLRRNTC